MSGTLTTEGCWIERDPIKKRGSGGLKPGFGAEGLGDVMIFPI